MPTVHYRDAHILINGYALRASFNEFGIEHGVETLDETAFGDTVRTHKGGLLTARVSGRGFVELGTGQVESVLFGLVGVDGTHVVLFPNGITEGSPSGYAVIGVLDAFNIGGDVGGLLGFDMSAAGRGIDP